MPALAVPSSSSLSSYQQSGLKPFPVSGDRKKNGGNQYHHSMIPSSSSSMASSQADNIHRTTPSPGSMRVDTRQAAIDQLQGNRKLVQPGTKNSTATTTNNISNSNYASSPGTRAARLKSSISSPKPLSETAEDIQRKLKENLFRCAQNG